MHTNHSTNQIAAQEATALRGVLAGMTQARRRDGIDLVDALKMHGIAEQAKAALRLRSAQLGRPELAGEVVAQMVAEMDEELAAEGGE